MSFSLTDATSHRAHQVTAFELFLEMTQRGLPADRLYM